MLKIKDFKYILKRIIIGIGITLGLMFLKPLICFADSPHAYVQHTHRSLLSVTSEPSGFPMYVDKDDFETLTNFKLEFNDITVFLRSEEDSYYLIWYNEQSKTYFINFIWRLDRSLYKIKLENCDNNTSGLCLNGYDRDNNFALAFNYTLIITENELSDFDDKINNDSSGQTQKITKDNVNYYFITVNAFNVDDYFNSNYYLYKSNVPEVYKNDKLLTPGDNTSIPENYTEVDFTGKDAILFWYKDFNNSKKCLNVDNIDDVCKDPNNCNNSNNNKCDEFIINYDFYITGSLGYALFDLKNSLDINNFTELGQNFKKYKNVNIDVNLGSPYQGIVFYNMDYGQVEHLGDDPIAKVKFDSNILNYKIIDDLNETEFFEFDFIDLNNDNHSYAFYGILDFELFRNTKLDFDSSTFESYNFFERFDNFLNNSKDVLVLYRINLFNVFNSIPPYYIFLIILSLIFIIILFYLKLRW